MPYLNGLAQKYSLLTQYYANTHPSIGNYFMMTTGQIITNSDGYTGTVTANNIVRSFLLGARRGKATLRACRQLGISEEIPEVMCGTIILLLISLMW
jgi:acid phosphatase